MKEIIKSEFDLFQTFNASKFNAENGIESSMTLWGMDTIKDVEVYAGIRSANEKVYRVVDVHNIKIMQGKTRSGINVEIIYQSDRGYTIGSWKSIKEFSNESGRKILEAIKEYLAR